MRKILTTLVLLLPVCAISQDLKTGAPRAEVMCGLQTYYDSLTLAFQNAAGADGKTLVKVQVLPSFQPEYAVLIQHTSAGISLFQATFRQQLWSQLGPPLHVSRTRQECLEIAKAADIETVIIPVSTEQANRLWETFAAIKLQTHACKKCALAQDGTQYVIQQPDGTSVRLQEAAKAKGLAGGNPPLLNWIHSVLQVVRQAQDARLSP